MTRPHRHEHDWLSRLNASKSMNDPGIIQAVLCNGLIDNFRNNSLGHAGVMFERHFFDTITLVEVAHGTDKHRGGTNTCRLLFGTKLRFKLSHKLPGIKDILLDAYFIHVKMPVETWPPVLILTTMLNLDA